MFLKLKTNNTNKNLIIIMLSYHRTCGMLSVFGFKVIEILIRLLIIVQTIGRDVLNILWGLKVLFSYTYTLKCFVVGVCQGLILGKILDLYFRDSIFKTPIGIIFFYCSMRMLKYYKKYVLLDEDPLFHLEGSESRRLKRALSYVGFGERWEHLEEPKRVEFMSDWHAYQRDLYSQAAVRQLAATYNSGSDEDDEKSDSDASSDLVECDGCGERDIDPNELDDSEKNLAEIGGGYAHEGCMSEEQLKEYEAALCGENENEELDEELEDINKDDSVNQDKESEDEESIKRGWFNWTKGEQHRKTV